MPDRRLPHARTLAVLRVLSWPYRYPPLSWMAAGIDWLAATGRRLAVTITVSTLVVLAAVIVEVTRG